MGARYDLINLPMSRIVQQLNFILQKLMFPSGSNMDEKVLTHQLLKSQLTFRINSTKTEVSGPSMFSKCSCPDFCLSSEHCQSPGKRIFQMVPNYLCARFHGLQASYPRFHLMFFLISLSEGLGGSGAFFVQRKVGAVSFNLVDSVQMQICINKAWVSHNFMSLTLVRLRTGTGCWSIPSYSHAPLPSLQYCLPNQKENPLSTSCLLHI